MTTLPIAIHPSWRYVNVTPLPWRARRGSGARTNSGMFSVVPAPASTGVPAARLDDALAAFGSVAVLKVDAEGLGFEILESGMTVIERDRPIIAVEAAAGTECGRIGGLLAPLGYTLVGQFCWTPTWLWAAH